MPSCICELTGLGAFNFAVQNSRREDAYARTLALLSRAPAVKLRLFYAVQVTISSERVVPHLIVVMPQHPVGLRAFRKVAWQEKNDVLLACLRNLAGEYDLCVLDYTEIASFSDKAPYFYDGSHVTAENARLILEQAVRDAPECFSRTGRADGAPDHNPQR